MSVQSVKFQLHSKLMETFGSDIYKFMCSKDVLGDMGYCNFITNKLESFDPDEEFMLKMNKSDKFRKIPYNEQVCYDSESFEVNGIKYKVWLNTANYTALHTINISINGEHATRLYSNLKDAEDKLGKLKKIFGFIMENPRKGFCKVCYDGELEVIGITEMLFEDYDLDLYKSKEVVIVGGGSYKDVL